MRLLWQGRTWEPGGKPAGERRGSSTAASPQCRVFEHSAPVADRTSDEGRLIFGDGLDVLQALEREGLAGKVQLAYVDPPYLSQTDYQNEARLDGRADGRVRRSTAYGDKWGKDDAGVGAYLEMLAPRLDALARMLTRTGTLWVQLDWRAAYLARVILDEIFGRGGFKNEIVWRRAPNLGRQATSGQFGRTLDTLLVYGGPDARLVPPTRLEVIDESAIRWDEAGRPFTAAPRGDYTDISVAKLDAEGRIHRTASGKVYIKYFLVRDSAGRLCRERRVDALWTDVAPLRHAQPAERTGYPTQKPLTLLERVIACGTKPGDTVIDVFAGSGTTGEAAHRLGRRFILADSSPLALATARARLLRAGAAFRVDECGAALIQDGEPEATAVRKADGCVDVTLVEPAEPLAWAVHADPDSGRIFASDWRGERKPGTKAGAAPVIAELGPLESERVAVRVYEDDGTVRESLVSVQAKGRRPRPAKKSKDTAQLTLRVRP